MSKNNKYGRQDMIQAMLDAMKDLDTTRLKRKAYIEWREEQDKDYPSKSTIYARADWDTLRLLAKKKLEGARISETKNELSRTEETIIDKLKNNKYPINRVELIERLEDELDTVITEEDLTNNLERLENKGYDIKTIRDNINKYTLVRNTEKDNKYKPLNEFDTPIMISGDWHIGSEQFSVQAFNSMLDDIDDYGIKTVLHLGDLIQGLGVHRLEAKDIKEPDIDSQVELAMNKVSEVNAEVHGIIGNHEEKLKGKHRVGFDALKYIANNVSNFTYYGAVASFLINDEYKLTMTHGSGGGSYALSYPLQKTYRNLAEKPDIFLLGHYHTLQHNSKHGNSLITAGTMQRENSWLIRKGVSTEVGYHILREFDDRSVDLVKVTPSIY